MDDNKGRKIKNKNPLCNVTDTKDENTSIEDHHNGNIGNDCNIDNNVIPSDIDIHFQMYGKHAWEVQYGEKCPVCEKRIDEFGYCACGSKGE